MSWIYPEFILDLGFVLDLSWICPGSVLDLSWLYPGFVLDVPWICPGCALSSEER